MSYTTFPVWVGSLSTTTDENTLRKIFLRFGPVRSVSLQRDPMTGQSRNFAYVNFLNREVAESAAREMDGKEINGKVMKVKGPTKLERYEASKDDANVEEKVDFRPLTDCHFFLNGKECSPKTVSNCPYRHSKNAAKTNKVCFKWLKKNCMDVKCVYKHPGTRFSDPKPENPQQLAKVDSVTRQFQAAKDNTVTDHLVQMPSKMFRGSNNDGKGKDLEPIGVFWDIENCPVPAGKSALSVVHKIRKLFYPGKREAIFLCVCDTTKEKKEIVDCLNNAQVDVLHVSATSKNAADDKLRQALRRFAQDHQPPATVVLLSGDVNFCGELSDLMHRNTFTVILVHNTQAPQALKQCAHQLICYSDFVADLPSTVKKDNEVKTKDILVSNIPINVATSSIRTRLSLLSNNCGGKVKELRLASGGKEFEAILRFPTPEAAEKAKKRMHQEDIEGSRISTKLFHAKSEEKVNAQSKKSQSPIKAKTSPNANVKTPPQLTLQRNVSNGIDERKVSTTNNKRERGKAPNKKQSQFDGNVALAEPCQMLRPNNVSNNLNVLAPLLQGVIHGELSDVSLAVVNLDPQVSQKDLKSELQSLFREHCKVLSVTVVRQKQGRLSAYVRVPKLKDAQLCISKVNGKSFHGRDLAVSLASEDKILKLKSEVASILLETNSGWLPLDVLVEVYQDRYNCSLNLHKLDQLKDLVYVDGKPGSQFICLLYFQVGLLKVKADQSQLANEIADIIKRHNRKSPTASLPGLYWSYTGKYLPVSEDGISLQNVMNKCGALGQIPGPVERQAIFYNRKKPPKGTPHRADIFLDETVEMLKHSTGFQIPLSKFVATYHQFFGRQCVVSDFGAKSLNELFTGDTIDVTGQGENRQVGLRTKYRSTFLRTEMRNIFAKEDKTSLHFLSILPKFYQFYGRRLVPRNYGFSSLVTLIKALPRPFKVKGKHGKNMALQLRERSNGIHNIKREIMALVKSSECMSVPLKNLRSEYRKKYGKEIVLAKYQCNRLSDLLALFGGSIQIKEHDGEKYVLLSDSAIVTSINQGLGTHLLFGTKDGYIFLSKYAQWNKSKLPPGTDISSMLSKDTRSPLMVLGEGRYKAALHRDFIRRGEELSLISSVATKLLVATKGHTMQLDSLFQALSEDAKRSGVEIDKERFTNEITANTQAFEVSGAGSSRVVLLKRERALIWVARVFSDIFIEDEIASILLESVVDVFARRCKFQLNVVDFGCVDIASLVKALPSLWIKLKEVSDETKTINSQIVVPGKLSIFRKNLRILLVEEGGICLLADVAPEYTKRFKEQCKASDFGSNKMVDILQQLTETFLLLGKGATCIVVLKEILNLKVPRADNNDEDKSFESEEDVIIEEEIEFSSGETDTVSECSNNVDLLEFSESDDDACEWWMTPVPSSLPNPPLNPHGNEMETRDLMSFSGFSGKEIESGGLPVDMLNKNPHDSIEDIHLFDPVLSERQSESITEGDVVADTLNKLELVKTVFTSPGVYSHDANARIDQNEKEATGVKFDCSLRDKEHGELVKGMVSSSKNSERQLLASVNVLDQDVHGLLSMLNSKDSVRRIAANFSNLPQGS